MSTDGMKKWEKKQLRTFCKWGNMYLQKRGKDKIEVDDYLGAFTTGNKLAQLLYCVYDIDRKKYGLKKDKKLKMRPQKLDNVSRVLKMFPECKKSDEDTKGININKINLGPMDILDCAPKKIMGMTYLIILNSPADDDDSGDRKKGLLMWCNKMLKPFGRKVANFHRDWQNGMAFLGLQDACGYTDAKYASRDESDWKTNITDAFEINNQLTPGLGELMEVDEFDCEKPPEKSVFTVVLEMFKALGSAALAQQAHAHIKDFIRWNMNMDNKKDEFENSVEEFMTWAKEKTAFFGNNDFADLGKSDAHKLQDAYKNYLLNEKPKNSVAVVDINQAYQDIATQLKINDRAAFTPETGVDDVNTALGALLAAESAYMGALNAKLNSFATARDSDGVGADTLKEIKESFQYFDKDSTDGLNPDEFAAAMNAVGVPIADDEILDTFRSLLDGGDEIPFKNYEAFMVKFYEKKDTYDSIMASANSVAPADQLTFESFNGLDDEEKGYLEAKIDENGGFEPYVKGQFA